MDGEERPWLYVERNGELVAEPDPMAWARAMEDEGRIIAHDEIDGVTFSTVFVGIDAAISGPPMVYETMVFGGPDNGWTARHATRGGARLGHAAAVERQHHRSEPDPDDCPRCGGCGCYRCEDDGSRV